MSLRDRLKAAEDAAVVTTPGGWRVRLRALVPTDFAAGETADDLRAYVAVARSAAAGIQAIEAGTIPPDMAEEIRGQFKVAAEDPENRARSARLQRRALLMAVQAIAAPGDELEEVQVVEDSTDLPRLALADLASMLGHADFAWLADVALWRCMGGEAGQKAAIYFRSVRAALVAGKDGAGVAVPTVGSPEGQPMGSPA